MLIPIRARQDKLIVYKTDTRGSQTTGVDAQVFSRSVIPYLGYYVYPSEAPSLRVPPRKKILPSFGLNRQDALIVQQRC